jgi:hypothetical protein
MDRDQIGQTATTDRQGWWIAVAIFVVSLALRIPFRSEYAYMWDGAQFALAMERFDMRLGLPHAPGFYLYLMVGRVVNLVVGDPHASLVWMSVVAGSVLPVFGFFLGTAMFGRRAGFVTALVLATSPLTWFHSEVALTTVVDSALVVATALVAWRAIQHGGSWWSVVGLGALLAVIAGIRLQTVPMLLPVWFYTFLQMRGPRLRKLLVAGLVCGASCAVWFLPLLQATGGWSGWWGAMVMKMEYDRPRSAWACGWDLFSWNVGQMFTVCALGLLVGGLIAAAGLIWWMLGHDAKTRREGYVSRQRELIFLGLWIVPMCLFWALTFMMMPGYVLNFFPALVLVVAWAETILWRRFPSAWRRVGGAVTIGAVAVVNLMAFLLNPPWVERLGQSVRLTAEEISDHDRQLGGAVTAIRERYRPGEVVVCHYGQWYYWGVRHFQYHLPEYESWLLTPDRALATPMNAKLWCVKGTDVQFVERFVPSAGKKVILVVPPGERVDVFSRWFNLGDVQRFGFGNGVTLYEASSSKE